MRLECSLPGQSTIALVIVHIGTISMSYATSSKIPISTQMGSSCLDGVLLAQPRPGAPAQPLIRALQEIGSA